MDAAGLMVLLKELEADCQVARTAATSASQHLKEGGEGRLQACAYELGRLYNVLERMLERICTDFENHFEKRGDYHERLLQRLTLELPGIRPAFIPAAHVAALREPTVSRIWGGGRHPPPRTEQGNRWKRFPVAFGRRLPEHDARDISWQWQTREGCSLLRGTTGTQTTDGIASSVGR
jgi:HepT-like protein